MDELFPERVPHHKRGMVHEGSSLSISATESPVTSPDEHSSIRSAESRNSQISINQPVDNISDQGNYRFAFLSLLLLKFLLDCVIST